MNTNNLGWGPSSIGDEFRKGIFTADEVTGAQGNLANPLLDLPLNSSLAMKQGSGNVNFSRSSTATYIDRYGVLQYASIDEPRFETDGFLVEGASTNLQTDSDLVLAYSVASASFVSTNNYANISMHTYNFNVGTGGGDTNGIALADAQTYIIDDIFTQSVAIKYNGLQYLRLRRTSATQTDLTLGVIDLLNGTVSSTTSTANIKLEPISDGVYILSASFKMTASSTSSLGFRLQADNTADATGSNGVTIGRAQMEKLPFASSYIPTTTTALTRNADECWVDYINNVLSSVKSQTITYEFSVLGIPTASLQSGACGIWGINGDLYRYTRLSTFAVTNRFLNTSGIDLQLPPIGTLIKHTHTYDETTAIVYEKGLFKNSESTDGSGVVNGSPSTNKLHLGRTGHSFQYLYGHIKNFRIYDKALTSTEGRIG